MVVQGQWDKDPLLLQVPHFNADIVGRHAWLCFISIMVECELIFLFEILAERLKNHEPAVETVFDLLELEDSAR